MNSNKDCLNVSGPCVIQMSCIFPKILIIRGINERENINYTRELRRERRRARDRNNADKLTTSVKLARYDCVPYTDT